ncbi:dual specificity protein phosphatase 22 isoform X3 [Eubalaena glacialis]|uniref:dual specificity protein phosphatase 22 isoform X3 n=1 Tax=Eubalaena glacialis TaxID=27606 RepID=UPI002A5AABD3|nr:dual specificity protein phosphatase 22 isoform X3 [Eubalaena glacialis]
MGNGMNKILPGLYIGNFKDARDAEQLSKNKVTHILSVHDSARPTLEGVKYLCIPAADSPSQNLTRHFKESIQFIHECRLRGEGCLVHWVLQGLLRSRHRNSFSSLPPRSRQNVASAQCPCRTLLLAGEFCLHVWVFSIASLSHQSDRFFSVYSLAGVSRSVTLVVAYIMTVTDFGWEDALRTVRAGRSCANPNLGFQRQLQEFEERQVHQFRQWLKEEYGESPLRDAEEARGILGKYKEQGRTEPPPGAGRWGGLPASPPPAYGSCTTET